jgi:uncharacterized protein (DUF2267 family)
MPRRGVERVFRSVEIRHRFHRIGAVERARGVLDPAVDLGELDRVRQRLGEELSEHAGGELVGGPRRFEA